MPYVAGFERQKIDGKLLCIRKRIYITKTHRHNGKYYLTAYADGTRSGVSNKFLCMDGNKLFIISFPCLRLLCVRLSGNTGKTGINF